MALKRHAFLIMAHGQWEHLKILASLLDHPRVDLYLHVDQKSNYPTPDPIQPVLSCSSLYYVPRMSVNWGGRSQLECEFRLIRAALPQQYAYYHLISGVDLPLKPISEILSFFDREAGKEFVHFDAPKAAPAVLERFSLYYPLQEKAQASPFCNWLQWKGIALQKRLGINRLKHKEETFYKGANWFSCTHEFLWELVRSEKEILRRYRFSRCCDEIFLQSFLMGTLFRDRLYDTDFSDSNRSNQRHIDWTRGEPYVFRETDLEELLSSPYLFARKFDYGRFPGIVNALAEKLREKESEK